MTALLALSGSSRPAVASGDLRTVALRGDAAPGTEPGVEFSWFSPPALNNEGRVAFRSSLTGSVGSVGNEAIYAEDAQDGLSLIARQGEAAPTGASATTFNLFTNPSLGDDGSMAFFAELVPTDNSFFNTALFQAGAGASLSTVAQAGEIVPDGSPSESFLAFGSTTNTGRISTTNNFPAYALLNGQQQAALLGLHASDREDASLETSVFRSSNEGGFVFRRTKW
ncbi:MAG: choice-of-anchor tandem repeat NxxGxxAF-containing protein [Planctomycetota bacterium]